MDPYSRHNVFISDVQAEDLRLEQEGMSNFSFELLYNRCGMFCNLSWQLREIQDVDYEES